MPKVLITCPNCKNTVYKSNSRTYGNPVKICRKCGKQYIDYTIKEPALYGCDHISDILMKSGIFSLLAAPVFGVCFIMTLQEPKYSFLDYLITAGSLVLTILFVFVFVHFFLGFINENKNHYVAGQLKKQRDYDESVRRLQDTGYLRTLAQSDPRARNLYTARSKGKPEIYAKRPSLKINSDRRRKEAAELEEARKQAALEEAKRQAELEAARKKAELEEARKKAELEEARKKAELEEARKKAELEEARKKAELEEAKRQAELEEARKKAELEEARKKAALEEARKKAEVKEARKKAELEKVKKKTKVKEARKQAELKAREEIAKLEAKSLADETPFKLSADITAQYGVMNKITLIDHFNRRKIYKDSKHEYYYFLESMSLVFIGFPTVYWYKLNYDKSGKVYYYENKKPLHEGYLESLTAEKLFEFIAIALDLKETSVLFNEFVSDERVINWCACVREFGKELYDMASEVTAQYNIPYSMKLYEVRGPGQMNNLDLEFGAFPGYSYNISFFIQFGHTDCSYVTEHIPADLLASLTAENLIDIIPVNHFCNTNEFISDERVIKWCECVRKFAEKLALGTEAKARSKKLEEYQTFINTDGKLPEEFCIVKNTIREAMRELAKVYDGNRGDLCMSLFLQIKDGCDFHSALEKIIRWKKNHLEYDTGYSWQVGDKLCTGNLPASATNEWEYGQQTMILTEDKPDITETEISKLKEADITLCKLIGKTSYYDRLDGVVYMYDYSEEPGMVDDAATYAHWSKEIVAEGDAAYNMLQKEIEKENTVY